MKSLDKDGAENARPFYLEAWSGTGSYTFDRIGRGRVHIESACVSILGGIQPGPLADYVRGAAKADTDTTGLALLCESKARLDALNRQLREEGETYRTEGRHGLQIKRHPAVTLRDTAQKQVAELLVQFGLTPLGRQRQKITSPAPKRVNRFDRFKTPRT